MTEKRLAAFEAAALSRPASAAVAPPPPNSSRSRVPSSHGLRPDSSDGAVRKHGTAMEVQTEANGSSRKVGIGPRGVGGRDGRQFQPSGAVAQPSKSYFAQLMTQRR